MFNDVKRWLLLTTELETMVLAGPSGSEQQAILLYWREQCKRADQDNAYCIAGLSKASPNLTRR